MALSHLVLATMGGKVLIAIVVVPGPVLRPILVEVLGATAILVRPRRSTVTSAVVHYSTEHELAPRLGSFGFKRLGGALLASAAGWGVMPPTVTVGLPSVRGLLVRHAGAHAVLLALRRPLMRHRHRRRPPGAGIPV